VQSIGKVIANRLRQLNAETPYSTADVFERLIYHKALRPTTTRT